jgi:hypothetical protein
MNHLCILFVIFRQFSSAFVIQPSISFHKSVLSQSCPRRSLSLILQNTRPNNEWDHILSEGSMHPYTHTTTRRNIVQLPDSTHAATLVSTAAAMEFDPYGLEEDDYGDEFYKEEDLVEEKVKTKTQEEAGSTPFQMNEQYDAFIKKKSSKTIATTSASPTQDQPMLGGVKNFLKGKDFGEIFFMVIVPVIAGYALTKTAYAKATDQLSEKADDALDSYANEMIYHDGNLEEMKFSHDHYNKKLVWLGPKKSDAMIKRYLEMYAKKKVVSPQAIRYA